MTMNKILFALMALFGLGAGLFIGMGNFEGFAGAIIPGIIIGALVSIPSIRERSWPSVATLIVCGLLGSVAASALPDSNGVKQFCRQQTNLFIHVGHYQLGADPE